MKFSSIFFSQIIGFLSIWIQSTRFFGNSIDWLHFRFNRYSNFFEELFTKTFSVCTSDYVISWIHIISSDLMCLSAGRFQPILNKFRRIPADYERFWMIKADFSVVSYAIWKRFCIISKLFQKWTSNSSSFGSEFLMKFLIDTLMMDQRLIRGFWVY